MNTDNDDLIPPVEIQGKTTKEVSKMRNQVFPTGQPRGRGISDCNHIYDEHGLCFECDAKQPYDQVAADKRYRKRQQDKGIVRKTVRVPQNRWEELQAICKVMREEA